MNDAAGARLPVRGILSPRSIAIIGASEDAGKFGGRVMHNLVRHRFAGTVRPVNPNRATLLGLPAFASIGDVPEPVDLAVVAVPAALLLATIQACAAAGVKACIVFTARLGEYDAAGVLLQTQVLAVARAHGMRLVGPNCMGIIAPNVNLALTSSATLQTIERLRAGQVGLVSQSGAFMGTLFILGHDNGVGFSCMVSVGNQADLDLCDFFEGLIDDPGTTTVCLYIEAVPNGARFAALARRAHAIGKRVLAVKAGRTDAGTAMARSHTASLAGSFAAFEASCRATGVLVMDEAEGMVLTAGVLSRAPRLGAGGIAVVLTSGGAAAVLADRLTLMGLPLMTWSDATRARLAAHFLPAHQNNPLDIGSHEGALTPEVFATAFAAALDDPGTAAFLFLMTPQPLMVETVDEMIAAWRRTEKPVVFVLNTSRFGEEVRQRLLEAGVPFVTRVDDALRVLDALFREKAMAADLAMPSAIRPVGAGPLPAVLATGFLSEPDTKALLTCYGIPATREVVVNTLGEALGAAASIGYPVVLKGVSRHVVHKSDAGLVALDLVDDAALRKAFAEIQAALAIAAPGEAFAAVVQEMVRGEAELLVGARYDPDFGPLIVVGFGGVLVEVHGDVQTACAPIDAAAADALLRRLRMWPVLAGVRNRPALDVAAAADALSRLSWLAADLGPRLQDIEINPLIVRRATLGVVAADGRGTLEEPA